MTYVIAEPCIGVKDRSCVDVCPVDCIYEGECMPRAPKLSHGPFSCVSTYGG